MSFSAFQGAASFPPIDFRAALNDDQYAAVTAPDGPALILAGAGSGKTRTLTYRVAYLLANGARPWEILLLTFTNKAAREMLERVEDLTGVPRGEFWGGTFHSIGARFLRRNADAAGISANFTIMDSGDADVLFKNVAHKTAPGLFKAKSGSGITNKPLLDAISFARNTRRPFNEVFDERFRWLSPANRALLPEIAAAYTKAKRDQNLCDYDDLLELWLDTLKANPDIRARLSRRYRHILVDEFQDTNKLQAEIVDAIAGDHQVMAVGDDAQCIYTWRGAEFANIADFSERHPGAQIHKIEINYRSSPEILAFANGILATQGDPTWSKTLRPVRPSGNRPFLIPTLDNDTQARLVAKCVRNLVLEQGRSLRDITILYRAHFHAMELQLELQRAGIPFVITSGIRFFEQAHVRDVIAQLRFTRNPADRVAFSRIMALLPKVGARTTEKILDTADAVAARNGCRLLDALLDEHVIARVPEVACDDFKSLVLTLLAMADAGAAPPPDANGSAAGAGDGTDGGTLAELELPLAPAAVAAPVAAPAATSSASNAATGSALAGVGEPTRVALPEEIVRIAIEGWYGDYIKRVYTNWQERRDDLENLCAFAAKYDDLNELLSQLVLLTSETTPNSADEPAGGDTLRLTTIHQAKGLEFPVVIIIGCAEGLLPLQRAIENDDVSEERRLFYVACTRAMEDLYIFYPKLIRIRGLMEPTDVSEFISELSSDTYETLHVSARA
jgi:DNA helicase-2/ATP-dependent DNA helicase PcrA